MPDNEEKEQGMSSGQQHDERRKAQAAAARKWKLRDKHDYDWKRDER